MRALLLAALVLALVIATAPAAEAKPEVPPLVGQCNAVTTPCWDGDVVCVWVSKQVPQCVGLE